MSLNRWIVAVAFVFGVFVYPARALLKVDQEGDQITLTDTGLNLTPEDIRRISEARKYYEAAHKEAREDHEAKAAVDTFRPKLFQLRDRISASIEGIQDKESAACVYEGTGFKFTYTQPAEGAALARVLFVHVVPVIENGKATGDYDYAAAVLKRKKFDHQEDKR